MKTVIKSDNLLSIEVDTTREGKKTLFLPVQDIHYWYPFNINFYYKYSSAKEHLYLVQDKEYKGENIYSVRSLKLAKPLQDKGGTPFNPEVYKRNLLIMSKAQSLGLPIITDEYTLEKVQRGFKTFDKLLGLVRAAIQQRYLRENEEAWFVPEVPTNSWDIELYGQATPQELAVLEEFGEMYSMLTLMRKIAEGR